MRRRRLLIAACCTPALAGEAPARRAASVADPARLIVTPAPPLPLQAPPGTRQLRVYLPPGYATQPARRWPVVYFLDGQNLFDDATSFSGEWGADEVLDELAHRQGLELIAVAVDHGGEQRLNEYSPWDHERFGRGQGFATLRWLVDQVKPFVDARWRTQPGRASTALVGSSLGALISFAGLHRHREVFGLGGLLSPSFWIAPQSVQALALGEPLDALQRVAVYAGGRESPDMLPQARQVTQWMRRSGAAVQWIEEPFAGHHEAAWRAALPRVLAHLFG